MTKKEIRKIIKKETRQIDLDILSKYSADCYFIIETGAGESTKYLAESAKKNNAKMVTIEINKEYCDLVSNVEYKCGWSISYQDLYKYYISINSKIIRKRIKKIFEKKTNKDIEVVMEGENLMTGETDIIRKILKQYSNLKLDFFFCDSGELCGFPEWQIVKDEIKVGGYFAAHDIYYPKSIKCFKVYEEIKNNKNWKIKEKTKSRQGLLIAQKIA